MTKNILLVGANKREFAKIFEEKTEIKRILIVEEWYQELYSIEKYEVIKYVKSINDFSEIKNSIDNILKITKIDSVIAVSERAVPTAGFIREYLGIKGLNYKDSLVFTDKYLMKEYFSKLEYSLPFSKIKSGTTTKVNDFPVIIKPNFGSATKGIKIIYNSVELKKVMKLLSENVTTVVEPYIKVKDEFHVDSIIINGEIEFSVISKYFIPVLERNNEDGLGSFVMDKNDPLYQKIEKMHHHLIASLNTENSFVTHCEFLLDESNNLYFGEIACRPGGGKIIDLIHLAYGINFYEVVIELELNNLSKIKALITQSKKVNRNNKIFGWVGLPIREGVVIDISESRVLSGIKGVLKSQIDIKQGDQVDKNFNSCSISGYAAFAANSVQELLGVKNEILQNFVLETRT